MTIAEMRTQIRAVVDIDSSDISDTVLNNMLGQGFDTIVYSEKRWPFYEGYTTFTTTNGTNDYSLTTIAASPDAISQGIREIISLKTDDHIIEYVGRDYADGNWPLNVSNSGQPWQWSYWQDAVRLYPTPDSNSLIVYVRAIRNPTSFGVGTSDGTAPDLPDAFHPVLATYGIFKAYLQQEDPVMAQQYFMQFRSELDNVARRFADTPSPQPMIANSRTSTRNLAGTGALRYASTGGVIW